jgi:hypothetical protein
VTFRATVPPRKSEALNLGDVMAALYETETP